MPTLHGTLALLPALLIALLDRHQDRNGGSKASGSDADTHAKPVTTDQAQSERGA